MTEFFILMQGKTPQEPVKCPVEGTIIGDLGIHKYEKNWRITDVPSGLMVCDFRLKKNAVKVAKTVLASQYPKKVGNSHDDLCWREELKKALGEIE